MIWYGYKIATNFEFELSIRQRRLLSKDLKVIDIRGHLVKQFNMIAQTVNIFNDPFECLVRS